MRVFILGVGGPVASGDFIQVSLDRASDHAGFTYGTLLNPVAGVNIVTLGYDGRLRTIVGGLTEGMAEGTAMEMSATQYHANGSVVDSIAATPFGNLDTHSYPWALLKYAAGSGSVSLDQILAAVQTTFPSTS